MDDNERLTALRNELVGLYPNGADIERVLHDAGIVSEHIALEESPANAWHTALVEAQRQRALEAVVAVAAREYPEARLAGRVDRSVPDTTGAAAEEVAHGIAKALLDGQSSAPDRAFKVLCVDDELSTLHGLRRLMARYAPSIVPLLADNVSDAFGFLERGPVDVVVTDLLMPDMGGEGVVNYVAEHYPGTPVVILSGRAGRVGYEVPHAGMFSKPTDGHELLRHLRRLVHGELCCLLRGSFGCHPVVLRTLLQCQDEVHVFLAEFSSAEVVETALRHKLKECVYRFSRALSRSHDAVGEALRLRREVDKLLGVAGRTRRGVTTGFAQYLLGVAQDLTDDHPGLEVTVHVDESSLLRYPAQMLPALVLTVIELLDNARDALDGRGEIRVTAQTHASEPALCVRVWSSKPIPPALAPRIFDEGVSTKGEGRGMGLALVQAMVLRVGGTVRLVQHDGAEFVLDFPTPQA